MKAAAYLGLSVVVGTHLAMVVDILPMSNLDKQTHAVVNLLAAGLILYGNVGVRQ